MVLYYKFIIRGVRRSARKKLFFSGSSLSLLARKETAPDPVFCKNGKIRQVHYTIAIQIHRIDIQAGIRIQRIGIRAFLIKGLDPVFRQWDIIDPKLVNPADKEPV